MKKKYNIHLTFALLALSIFTLLSGCGDEKHIGNLKKHLSYLASDELEGRYPTSLGDTLAREYIIDRYRECGLAGINNGSYLQGFDYLSDIDADGYVVIKSNKETQHMIYNKDFTIRVGSISGAIESNLVFIGYGIRDSNSGYDDFKNVNIKDNIVLCYLHPPRDVEDYVRKMAFKYGWKETIEYVASQGARGLIFVSPNEEMEKLQPIYKMRTFSQRIRKFKITVIQISRQVFINVMENAGEDIHHIEDELKTSHKSLSRNLSNMTIYIRTEVDYVYKNAYNIIGLLKGIDTTQNIIIGAHYDHLHPRIFEGLQDSIRNGADDNASGVSVLLELANRFSGMGIVGSNILFICFSAEESGAMGSRYFINNMPLPIGSIKAMINLDMVGRMRQNTLHVNDTYPSSEWKYLIEFIDNNEIRINYDIEGGYTDVVPFLEKEIPLIWISTGSHEDLHQVSDEIDKINFRGMEQVFFFIVDLLKMISRTDVRFEK